MKIVLEIRKNVPIPENEYNSKLSELTQTLRQMEVGDSVYLEEKSYKRSNVGVTVYREEARQKKLVNEVKFLIKSYKGSGLTIWRVS